MVASLPLIIYGIVKESGSGVNAITVKARNETTNEIGEYTTNSNGLYQVDLSDSNNFPSGWADDQKITIYTIYKNFEGQETVTIALPLFSYRQDITLSAVTDSELIYYTTVQNVYDELDAKTASDISAERIVKAVQRIEGLIERRTGTFFKSETFTDETHTADRYSLDISPDYLDTISSMNTLRRDSWRSAILNRVKTTYAPIISITSLSVNQAGFNSADSWTALTEQTGSGGDFQIEDADSGIIDFITTYPRIGKRSWKLTYVAGYSRTATDRKTIGILKVVERLTTLLACKAIITTKSTGSMFDSTQDIKIGTIEIKSGALSGRQYLTSIDPEIKELWGQLDDWGFEIV